MRNIIKILLLSLSFFSCDKEDMKNTDPDIPYFDFKIYSPGDQSTGSAQATVFGKTWNATAYRHPQDSSRYFEIYFETYSDEGFTRDQISFGLFDAKIGEYTVKNDPFDNNFNDFTIHSVYGLWASDGDLLYGAYHLDTSFDNKIIIEKNDGETIEGRFALLFTSNKVEHTDIPGRVFFKDGKFKVNL